MILQTTILDSLILLIASITFISSYNVTDKLHPNYKHNSTNKRDCFKNGAIYQCTSKTACGLLRGYESTDGCSNPAYVCCIPNEVSRMSKPIRPSVSSLLAALLSRRPLKSFKSKQPIRYRCGVPNRGLTVRSRIIGGIKARRGEHPWLAHLKIHRNQCGGAILNRYYIITAAHCVHKADIESVVITVGATDLKSWDVTVQTVGVSEIRIHPYFSDQPKQPDRFDVALVRLRYPLDFNKDVIPICLPDKEDRFEGHTGIITGWGQLTPYKGSKTATNMKRKLDVPIISNPRCSVWHMDKGIQLHLYPEMLCAGYELGGKDACRGDSGGPLVVYNGRVWILAGLISAGFGCAEEGQPGIYHRITSTVEWIKYYSEY